MGKSLQTKQIANEVLWIVVGCLLYSLSVVWFIDPAQIIPGSVTGIAVVTKALFGIPIGVLNLVVNIPLVLIGVFYLGIAKRFYNVDIPVVNLSEEDYAKLEGAKEVEFHDDRDEIDIYY